MDLPNSLHNSKEYMIEQIVAAQCFKTGQFTLKSGCTSPYYIDLRMITMHEHLLRTIVRLIKNVVSNIKEKRMGQEVAVVGVPYGVVPVASIVAYELGLAYYPVRKETKEYGNKQVSNKFENFQYILIEDVMSTGGSIVDTIKKLDGKKVTDVIVIVDREMGGDEKLRAEFPYVELHSIVKVSEIIKSPNLVNRS